MTDVDSIYSYLRNSLFINDNIIIRIIHVRAVSIITIITVILVTCV